MTSPYLYNRPTTNEVTHFDLVRIVHRRTLNVLILSIDITDLAVVPVYVEEA